VLLVLHEQVGKAADRRRAQPDQDRRLVIGEALEIAAQASVGRRSLERVAGKREMIEPDGAITGSDELPMTELRHRKTLCLPGERSLVDAALPRDQMRDVGIPEQRDAVGSEILRAVERVGQVVARLAWQP